MNSWKQIFLKLRHLSGDEARVRVRNVLQRRYERSQFRNGRPSEITLPPSVTNDLLQRAGQLVPGTDTNQLSQLRLQHSDLCGMLERRAVSRAKSILSGSWRSLGHVFDLRENPDWHGDPRSDYRWPRSFYADIDFYELGNNIDVKHVWELGRQQYLVELAHGFQFSGNDEYARRARELMLDWIRNNPLHAGVHWTSALEVAARSLSWIWTLATLRDWSNWQEADLKIIAAGLVEHARYLENHLSYYSSPYNHLIGEATALSLIGIVLRDVDESGRWRNRARKVLLGEGPRQFYSDGFSVEQSLGYHFYTLGFLVMAIHASRGIDEPLRELEPVVHRAFRAGSEFRMPDGRWPFLGDSDSARSIPVVAEDYWNFDSLCSLAAVLFDDADLKQQDKDAGEELFRLLGVDGVDSWNRFSKGSSSSAVLNESGHAIARRADNWLLFDAGPVAGGLHGDSTPSTAHGHLDLLQVLYFTSGREMLVDCGISSYADKLDSLDYFRSSAAHNTLEIEGVPAARASGRLAWSHVCEPPRLDAHISDEVWLLRGRLTLQGNVRITRHVLGRPRGGLWIADWIEVDRSRRVRWYWQFPAKAVETITGDETAKCVISGPSATLALWSDSVAISTEIHKANDDSSIAWQATGYGERLAGQRVSCEAVVEDCALVVTYIGSDIPPASILSVENRSIVCTIGSETVEMSNFETERLDADLVWQVNSEEELKTFIAGSTAKHRSGDWRTLSGIGKWPVARATQAVSFTQ